jgi:hypothetical protein
MLALSFRVVKDRRYNLDGDRVAVPDSGIDEIQAM